MNDDSEEYKKFRQFLKDKGIKNKDAVIRATRDYIERTGDLDPMSREFSEFLKQRGIKNNYNLTKAISVYFYEGNKDIEQFRKFLKDKGVKNKDAVIRANMAFQKMKGVIVLMSKEFSEFLKQRGINNVADATKVISAYMDNDNRDAQPSTWVCQ